eukprot:CAMPEP_0115439862 /NCGR_PEP_ID=MMETSP0271-20121206/35994_1 /TAXON_ID=71861 /ORGANISM="Scrippsiella trochoidea, Strain CCMP3099" /LENGTH=45 /DNA_ID= /DNA_START= /DNA_END= /DNA_ORIENTATION=
MSPALASASPRATGTSIGSVAASGAAKIVDPRATRSRQSPCQRAR